MHRPSRPLRTTVLVASLALVLSACRFDFAPPAGDVPAPDTAAEQADRVEAPAAGDRKRADGDATDGTDAGPAEVIDAGDAPSDDAEASGGSAADGARAADQSGAVTRATGLRALERELLARLNERRAAAGVGELAWDPTMAAGALDHSCTMAASKRFAHDSSFDGYRGENIAMFHNSQLPRGRWAGQFDGQWQESSGHRANRMNGRWTSYGAGICVSADGAVFATERFR